jgi:hypothetical protein
VLRRGDSTFLSGWLFADLLLSLAIIFLAMAPGAPEPPQDVLLTPSPTPTQIPQPTPVPTPECQRAVSLVKLERSTANSRATGQPSIPLDEQLRATFADLANSTAGLVLIYVRAPLPGQGQQLARQVVPRLQAAQPRLFQPDTIYEPFDFIDANAAALGGVYFQIYLLSDSCR